MRTLSLLLLSLPAFAADSWREPTGPDDLRIPYQVPPVPTESLLSADQDRVERYVDAAHDVLIGSVIATRPGVANPHVVIVSFAIEEQLKGERRGLIEFEVPLEAGEGTPGRAIAPGYTLLVFMSGGSLVEGESFFLVEGGYIWQNRRAGVLLKPHLDRAWIGEMDPVVDYVVLPLASVREEIAVSAMSKKSKRIRRETR